MSKKSKIDEAFTGLSTTTIGERGQVVIPAPIRAKLKFKAGDQLIAFVKHDVVCLVKAEAMQKFINQLSGKVAKIIKR